MEAFRKALEDLKLFMYQGYVSGLYQHVSGLVKGLPQRHVSRSLYHCAFTLSDTYLTLRVVNIGAWHVKHKSFSPWENISRPVRF